MNPKYELTDEAHPDNPRLHRIRALRDFADVRAGDLGGWIESEANLAQSGNAWVSGSARVYGNAWVYGSAQVYDRAWVLGNAQVSGNARVFGDAQVSGDAQIYGTAQVYDAQVYDRAWVLGNAQVSGNARVFGDAQVSGDARVYSPSTCLVVQSLPSGVATFTPAKGGGVRLAVGCWSGSPDTLRDLIAGTDWPEANAEQQDQRRPGLAALADLCDAVASAWDLPPTGRGE